MEINVLLSIIIPVYNVERYIKRCLDSIYNQDVDDEMFEVIIINDGTQDNSVDIAQQYVGKHKNCRLINQENQGLSMARNNGLKKAIGKYVWFVDSDDWIAEHSLETIFKYIKNGEYDVIASNLRYVYDDNRKDYTERTLDRDILVKSYIYILNYSVGASQRFIIKRSFILENNLFFYPGILHEDGEFGPRLILASDVVLLICTTVYMYYQRGNGSIMSSWTIRNTRDSLFIFSKDLELAKSIVDKELRTAVYYEALKVLLFAFPLKYIHDDEIKALYNEYKLNVYKVSMKLLISNLPIRKKILPLISLFGINTANKYREYRYNNFVKVQISKSR